MTTADDARVLVVHTPVDRAYAAAVRRGDDQQAAYLEQALEEYSRPPRALAVTYAVAAWYANRGLRVFPLLLGEKRPLPRSRGVTDATTDLDTISRWFGHSNINLGVATGGPYDVLDIDGADGAAAFDAVLGDGSWLVVRGVSQTPRGWHLWVPADPTARNGAGRGGFDYRGQGGYVVAPPSQVGGTVYRWLLPPIV